MLVSLATDASPLPPPRCRGSDKVEAPAHQELNGAAAAAAGVGEQEGDTKEEAEEDKDSDKDDSDKGLSTGTVLAVACSVVCMHVGRVVDP